MRDILILTDYRGIYRQDINRNKGIDIEKVIDILVEHDFNIEVMNYDTLVNEVRISNIKNKIIFYTSSQCEAYRSYIDDIMYELSRYNILLPRYEIFKCHENKCMEEVLRKKYMLDDLNSYVFVTYKDILKNKNKLCYPVIIKKSTGSGSISVYKADNEREMEKIVKRIGRGKHFWEFYFKYIYKKFKGKLNEEYVQDERYFCKCVIQQFIPDLGEDWKILAFGNRFYVLNRKVRPGDFRASGSGKFSFVEPPIKLLNKAKEVYEKLDVPFLSMDICIDKNQNTHLIEFQGIHFGPYTLIHSNFYFQYEDGIWNKVEEKSDLSEQYAASIIQYIDANKDRIIGLQV